MLLGRVLIVAFEGWNDATEAASTAARVIAKQLDAEAVAAVDPEDYYDFQFSRPLAQFDEDGNRIFVWPGAEYLVVPAPENGETPDFSRISLLIGAEPSRRWQSFAAEILEMALDREVDTVLFFGAMLADAPHTRPISVHRSSPNPELQLALDIEPSRYEGPVGITSILSHAFFTEGIHCLSLWASVPHYVHNSASPKAALALIAEFETLTGVNIDTSELSTEAFAWERGIDELVAEDSELTSYISDLEKQRDAADSAQAAGDALAAEFERYLQQRPGEDGGAAS